MILEENHNTKQENQGNFRLEDQFLTKKQTRVVIYDNKCINDDKIGQIDTGSRNRKEDKNLQLFHTNVDQNLNILKGEVKNLNTNQAILTNKQIKHKVSCNCKNSRCLKLYCDCFSTLLYCDPSVCSCKGCSNTPDNEVIK